MNNTFWAVELEKELDEDKVYFYDAEDDQYYCAEGTNRDAQFYASLAVDTEKVEQEVRQYLKEFFPKA